MSKQLKVSRLITRKHVTALLAVAVCSVLLIISAPGTRQVVADAIQDQINSLTQQNNDTRGLVSGLQAQAASYQDAINQLQAQINGIQANIAANQAQQASLQAQIVQAQKEIDEQKAILANDVKTMYVDGTPSTLEVLATSKDLSDFVDKQEYRTSVQNKLQDSLQKIAQLQSQLQTQKSQVDQLLTEEDAQKSQLASAQAQQASLLTYNKSQQTAYNAQIQTNSAQIAQLRAQQAAANKSIGRNVTGGDPGHGGYPNYLASAAQDSLIDPWGMYNRECVSYTAWKVQQTYGYMPYWGGQGNAIEWPGDARRAGIPTGSTPRANSVAIWNVGAFGHAMWVESVYDDGSIYVSQYNYDYQGHYSEMYVPASQAKTFTYIYFD